MGIPSREKSTQKIFKSNMKNERTIGVVIATPLRL